MQDQLGGRVLHVGLVEPSTQLAHRDVAPTIRHLVHADPQHVRGGSKHFPYVRFRADGRRARAQPLARRQERLHRLVVVRALPIPLRQVHLGTEVQVAPVRPLAQPPDAVVEHLTRRPGCEQRAAGRAENEDAVGSGVDRPPALVDQVMVERTLCRPPDYADSLGRVWGLSAADCGFVGAPGGIIRAQ